MSAMSRTLKMAILVSLSLLLCSSFSFGAVQPTNFGKALQALYGPLDTYEQRRAAALNISTYCKTFANAIPTLSPREEDWLEQEIRSPRLESAIESIEYSKRIAGRFARNCIFITESLASNPILEWEMLRWTELAALFADKDFHWHVDNLSRNRVVTFSTDDIEGTAWHTLMVQNILNRIVIPNWAP